MLEGKLKFSEIESSDIGGRGIYAWYVQLPNEKIFKKNRLKHVKKILSLYDFKIGLKSIDTMKSFQGHIETIEKIDFSKINLEDDCEYELLRLAVQNFLPPLYIGKTENNLSTRLKKHASILNNVSVSNLDVEDNRFKSQLMYRVNEKNIDKSWLYVKFISITPDTMCDSDAELRVEYLMNRIFNPVLGRN
jgi:hypothetical protein